MPLPDDRLRQGDLVETVSTQDDSLAEVYFIATADCDLANEKHFGKLLALPVMPLSAYYSRFRLPKLVDELRSGKNGLEDQSIFMLNELLRLSGEHSLAPADALSWINRAGSESICFHLRNQIKEDAEKQFDQLAMRFITTCQVMTQIPEILTFASAAEFIERGKNALGEKLKNGISGFFAKDLQNFLTNTPKDVFLVSEISAAHDPGFVVALRFPEQINSVDIALETPVGSRRFRRISRIVYPYSTAILHQFTNLFSSVGLPDEQKVSLSLAGELLIESWKQETSS